MSRLPKNAYIVDFSISVISLKFYCDRMCCVSVCVQTAGVAVFGGGSWNKYSAKSSLTINMDWSSTTDVYFDWCFWMAVAGGGLTLVSGVFYLIYDCCFDRQLK